MGKKTYLVLALVLASLTLSRGADSPIGLKPIVTSLDRSNKVAIVMGHGSTAVYRLLDMTNAFRVLAALNPKVDVDFEFMDAVNIAGDLTVTGLVAGAGSSISGTSLTLGSGFYDGLLAPSSNLTNYTVNPEVSERTVNATNNVHIATVSAVSSGRKYFPCLTLTNYSGADRLLTFASGWVAYGSPTNVIPSGKTARVMFEVEGSNVRYGVTIEGETGGGGSSASIVPLYFSDEASSNPLDSTVYLCGIQGGGFTTSGNWSYANRYCPKTGTINKVELRIRCTAGSNEDLTFVVRKNDSTDSSTFTIKMDAAIQVLRVTSLGFAVTAGDEIGVKFTTPAWVTNPTGARVEAVVYVE